MRGSGTYWILGTNPIPQWDTGRDFTYPGTKDKTFIGFRKCDTFIVGSL